jgi:uncharacterized RDD family membrane protein YckC
MRSNNLNEILTSLRKERGLDRYEFARLIGKDYLTVTKWELGSQLPTKRELEEIAERLSISAEVFGIFDDTKASTGVKAECGSFQSAEYKKAYEEKKERYVKYVRSSSYNTAGVKIKRIFAYLADTLIFGAAMFVLLLSAVLISLAVTDNKLSGAVASVVSAMLIAIVLSVLFVFRDFSFGGRSLGKRIFGLTVIDARTAEKSAVYQRIFRAIFQLSFIDVILFIISGRTVGDRVASTLVVSKKAHEAKVEPMFAPDGKELYDIPKEKKKDRAGIAVAFVIAVIAGILMTLASAFMAYRLTLEQAKKTEAYEVAYTYLTESDSFLKSGNKEGDVKLSGYSLTYSYGSEELECTYTFFAGDDVYEVTLHHGASSEWYVCDACTKFH